MASATPNGANHWPVKTREFQNHHADSRVWNDFKFRDNDIIVATYSKSGTTWMQQIVLQLVFRGYPSISPNALSPWVEIRLFPAEKMLEALEAQTHRRVVKTHLPLDALVYSPKAKYIFVGRDVRDMIWSLHNHFINATPMFYQMINDSPGRVGPAMERPPADPRQYFLDFLEDDSHATVPFPFWQYMRGIWAARDTPNMLLVHFNDLKAGMEGQIRRIAAFLEIDLAEDKWAAVFEHCTFDWMKAHAESMAPPLADMAFDGGADTFINKGTNGRWRDVLTDEDCKRYEAKARMELGEECARWLETGQR